MTIGMSSFGVAEEEEYGDCLVYAMAAMVDEQEMYGFENDRGAYLEGLVFYYDSCMSGGGNISDPVFL